MRKRIAAGIISLVALVSLAGCGAPQALDKTVDACEPKNTTLDKVVFYEDGVADKLGKIYDGDTLNLNTYDNPDKSPVLQCVRKKLPLSDADYEKVAAAEDKSMSATMSGYKAKWHNWGGDRGLEFALTKAD